MSKKTFYYVSGNTAQGSVNYLQTNITNINQLIILQHPAHTLKTAIINQFIKKYESAYDLEILLSSLGKKFLEGVIIREKSLAIIVDTIATDLSCGTKFDLHSFIEELPDNEESINAKDMFNCFRLKAYDNLAAGLKIHDNLEAIFINEMDFKRADQLAEQFVHDLLKDIPKKTNESHVYHRLFGTNTADGAVNIVPEVLAGLKNSFFIKGRAGTGKSTFMKKVLKACIEHGLNIELYHCSFDPNSIDMVLVRELNFCIFDSTDPHEFFPKSKGEEIIDMYEETIVPGTDEKYADQIQKVNRHYKSYMKKAIANLKEAGFYLDKLESRYRFTDSDVNRITTKVINKFT